MTIGNSGRDFLIHLALLPLLEFVMTSPRVIGRGKGTKRRGVTIAATALVAITAVKLGAEIAYKESSYYDMLEVLPTAQGSELKKGFKRASLKVHPDKVAAAGGEAAVDDEGADEAFMALRAAYEILSDTQQRDTYDKFGKPGLDAKEDTNTLLAGLGFFYMISLMLAYMLTRRKSVSRAQTWAFSGLLALGIFEYQTCVLSFDFLQDAMPQLAMFEKIELLHRIYPAYLLGARMAAYFFFEDVDAHNFVMLQHLHWKVDTLRARLELLAAAPSQRAEGPAPGISPLPPLGPDNTVSPEIWHALNKQAAESLMSGNDMQSTAVGTAPPSPNPALPGMGPPGAPAATSKPAATGGAGRNLGGLVWFFGVYFFFQWLLGRGN